jgi:nicotinate-nucleotide adenylyltransferase
MKNIAILGGTFNPIHNGHINMAKAAMEQFPLDKVWIMPNNKPGYKENKNIASPEKRCEMIRLATRDYDYMELSQIELERKGITYTADTLQALHTKYPQVYWYFIMGADSLFYIHKWKKPEVVLELSHILVAVRDDLDSQKVLERISLIENSYNNVNIELLRTGYFNISSTEIRKNAAKGKDITCMVPENVSQYIMDCGIYRVTEDEEA